MSGTAPGAAAAAAAVKAAATGKGTIGDKVAAATSRLLRRPPRKISSPSDISTRKSLGTPKNPLRVCVISSSYEGADSEFQKYDSYSCGPQNWVKNKGYTFDVKELDKAGSFRQVRELIASGKYDVFFNLCDGGRDEKRAGVDVLLALEEFNAAFTGTDSRSFEPNKIDMKILVGNAGVLTPNFVLLNDTRSLAKKCRHLKFPVIVKHVSGYASVGIHKDNRCENMEELEKKLSTFIPEYNHALVEEFIRGREGTVLVCRDPDSPHGIKVFKAMMLTFLKTPDDFAHFESKWTGEWSALTFEWLAETDPAYQQVVEMARNSFHHVLNGVGYGRCDFRIDAKGDAYFLEINPNCGMWYPPALTTGGDYADNMVKNDPSWNHETFVEVACRLALQQKREREPWYVISHDSHGHFSTRASRSVEAGRCLFGDGVHPIPVVAKALYKLGSEDNSSASSTSSDGMSHDVVGCVVKRADGNHQNVAIRHSCEPNLAFIHGQTLMCAAKRQISVGEELTLDYSTLRDTSMPNFACRCGTVNCRSVIVPHPPMPRQVDFKLLRKLLRERKRAAAESARQKREVERVAKTSTATTTPSEPPAESTSAAASSASDANTKQHSTITTSDVTSAAQPQRNAAAVDVTAGADASASVPRASGASHAKDTKKATAPPQHIDGGENTKSKA